MNKFSPKQFSKTDFKEWGVRGLELAIAQLKSHGIEPDAEILALLNAIKERPRGVFLEEAYRTELWWKFICPDCGLDLSHVGYAIEDGAISAANAHRKHCPVKQ